MKNVEGQTRSEIAEPFSIYRDEFIPDQDDVFKKNNVRRPKTISRVTIEFFKKSVLKAFSLIEPYIYYERKERVISESNFRGTRIFDVKVVGKDNKINIHSIIDKMDKRKIRVLAHKRLSWRDSKVYCLTEDDFWMIIDAIALLSVELRFRNKDTDPLKEEIYSKDVVEAIESLLSVRNDQQSTFEQYKHIPFAQRAKSRFGTPTISPAYILNGGKFRDFRHFYELTELKGHKDTDNSKSKIYRWRFAALTPEEKKQQGIPEYMGHNRINDNMRERQRKAKSKQSSQD